jgi:hypothetical protein
MRWARTNPSLNVVTHTWVNPTNDLQKAQTAGHGPPATALAPTGQAAVVRRR